MRLAALLAASICLLACGPGSSKGFGLTRLATADGKTASVDDFQLDRGCGFCHSRQNREASGSMHSVAHTDPLYRAFALLAKEEAGDEVYGWCSGCHSVAGVVTGYLPAMPDRNLPPEAKAGVSCDVCHQISGSTWEQGPYGEPGNASFVISPGRTKYGNIGDIEKQPAHDSKKLDLISTSEFCAGCHSVIHPTNGLFIEHTYGEWKKSVYAEKGIRCQDCHMRHPSDAAVVARDLEARPELGFAIPHGPERVVHDHRLVGANVDAGVLSGSTLHAELAVKRLKTAATIAVEHPAAVEAGTPFTVTTVVRNVGAGHGLPTALTELREMWILLEVLSGSGEVLFESGALDEHGEVTEGAIRFGAALADANGKATYRPWEATRFLWKKQVPPRGESRDPIVVTVPAGTKGKVTIRAKLLYRTAPPHVVKEVMGAKAFIPRVVSMCVAEAELQVK